MAISLVLLLVVIAPFFMGSGGSLVSASTEESIDKLEAVSDAIVRRYLAEEADHNAKAISDGQWRIRQKFLVNRYVDAIRRSDYLKSVGRKADQ